MIRHSAHLPKTVLVTGASSGIGAATAARLVREGHTVVLGARRVDRLAESVTRLSGTGGAVDSVHLDVTDADSVRRAVDHVREEHGRLDVLINNAGVMPVSALAENKVEEWNRMIDVNIRGVLHGISAALPVMRAQRSGHVITVASTGAHEVVPTAAVYCATKYAAWAISEGLRIESEPWLRVTTITPGVTESELAETISDPDARAAMREYRSGAIPATAIADAMSYAINADPAVDVNEIIVRPVRQRP
ncbi:NADP-dependent 3-hydroxy acid dehydrogenase YdfG [Actinoalloteichus hoggarensis]|uniref:Putative oxidoreductase n=1 Tax=Actinoalloteichus hoggarensis TaxID=1470176 RepID=A0A221VWD1_9PSEU|nr:SDR family oxidoreductase [Actinoalloteichus hoggarensis]ASO17859.1 putative oxidoreductase [Actinoalloteichus hoggarensis]MBB5924271.1 NADP-dependent 3-hydroxy acid dehydrogenase YdfG [Actinoalloteichus hoggarensis]